jgi:hypothetical protein
MPRETTLERQAADLLAAGRTKLATKKELIAGGASQEQAALAVEAGGEIYQRERKKRRFRNRIIGAVILVVGLALNAYTFFCIEGAMVAVGIFIVVALAGLVTVIDPDTLGDLPSFFWHKEE